MSKTLEQMSRDFEIFVNEQAVDLAVFRVTLQTMFLTMLSNHPKREEMVGGLKGQVLAALERPQPNPEDPQGSERQKQLTLMRAEEFFQEVEEAMGLTGSGSDPASRH